MKTQNLIIIGIAAVIILAVIFRSSPSEKIRDLAKKELQKKELTHKRTLDSIQNLRESEKTELLDWLKQVDYELEQIKNKYHQQNQKIKSYEKELATYRNGDYDERYGVFSETYNPEGYN